jgi:hypothetical protein
MLIHLIFRQQDNRVAVVRRSRDGAVATDEELYIPRRVRVLVQEILGSDKIVHWVDSDEPEYIVDIQE